MLFPEHGVEETSGVVVGKLLSLLGDADGINSEEACRRSSARPADRWVSGRGGASRV